MLLVLSTAVTKFAYNVTFVGFKNYSKCASPHSPALTHAAKTQPLTIMGLNGCCTVTFACCGDVHSQHGHEPNKFINFRPKVIDSTFSNLSNFY